MVQSFVCSLQNECQRDSPEDLANAYPDALIHKLLKSPAWRALWRAASPQAQIEEDLDSESWVLRRIEELPASVEIIATLADIINHPEVRDLLENGVRVKDVVADEAAFNETLITYGVEIPVAVAILNSGVNLHKILSLAGYPNMRTIVCDSEKLGKFLVMPSESEKDLETISQELCQLDEGVVPSFADAVIRELDGKALFDKVEKVVAAVGGYESDSTLSALAGMLDAIGRLEPLVALGPVLSSLGSALAPLGPVRESLMASDMSLDDVDSLLESFGGLLDESQEVQISLQKLKKSLAMVDFRSHTLVRAGGPESEPFEALLGRVQDSVRVSGNFTKHLIETLKSDPRLHTIILLASATLPIIISPDEYPTLSIMKKYDAVVPHLPEVLQEKVNGTLMMAATMTQLTKVLLDSSECVAEMVKRLREVDLPPHVVLKIAERSVNLSAVSEKLAKGELSNWLCSRKSWPLLEDKVWSDFEEQLCHRDAAIPALSSCLKDVVQESEKLPPTSNFLETIYRVFVKLNDSLPNYENIFQMAMLTLEEDYSRQRRETVEDEEEKEETLLEEDEALQSLKSGRDLLQEIIRNMVELHFHMMKNLARHPAVLDGEAPFARDFFAYFNNSDEVNKFVDLTCGSLDALIHALSLMVNKTYNGPGQVVRDPKVWKFLTEVLSDDALKVAETYAHYMDSPFVSLPSPLPQLLGLLEPTANFISKTKSKYSMKQLLQQKTPSAWKLGSKFFPLLPRLSALPVAWFLGGLQKHGMDMLKNPDAWPKDSCNVSAVTSFVNATDVKTLPASWKETHPKFVAEVKKLEQAICTDYVTMMKELEKFEELGLLQERLSELGSSLQPFDFTEENFGNVSVHDLMKNIHVLAEGLPRLRLETFDHVKSFEGSKTLKEEIVLAFNVSAWPLTTKTALRTAAYLLDILLQKFAEDAVLRHFAYFSTHAKNISKAITQHFKDGGTPLELLGPVPFLATEDSENTNTAPERSPAELAIFLLREAIRAVSEVLMIRGFDPGTFVSEMCMQAQNSSIHIVEKMCSLMKLSTTDQPPPESFVGLPSSPVAMTIMDAIVNYENPSNTSDVTTNLKETMESLFHLLEVLNDKFPDVVFQDIAKLKELLNEIHQDFQNYLEGFTDFATTDPSSILEQWVGSDQELQKSWNEVAAVVLWLNRTLPDDDGQFPSDLVPTEAKSMLLLLNETLPDLIDLLEYNLDPDTVLAPNIILDLRNLTLENLCNNTSALHPLPLGNVTGDILQQWCSFNFSAALEAVKVSLGLKELREQVLYGYDNVSLSTLWGAGQRVFQRALNLARELSMRSDNLPSGLHPPRLLQEKDILLSLVHRLASRWKSSNEEVRMVAVKMILEWILKAETDEDFEMSSKAAHLLMARAKLLLELVLKSEGDELPMLLNDHRQLRLLLKLLTTSLPAAVKDVHHLLTTDPQGTLHSLLGAGANLSSIPNANHSLSVLWDRICGSNTIVNGNANAQNVPEATGSDVDDGLNSTRRQLCFLNFEDLLKEVRELALLPEIKKTFTSISDLVNASVSLHNLLATLYEAEGNTFVPVNPVTFLNLKKWLDLPQQVFGVSADVYWEKSPLSILEKFVDSNTVLLETRNEVAAVVLWLNRTLPDDDGQFPRDLVPTEAKSVMLLLNETLPDLIALLEYNLDPDTVSNPNTTLDLRNLTLKDLCNNTSALHPLPLGNTTGDILQKWCSFNFSAALEAVKVSLGLKELREQVSCSCKNVSLSTLWGAAQRVFLRALNLTRELSTRSDNLPSGLLPSTLFQEKDILFSLAHRLASSWNSSNEEVRIAAVKRILDWMLEAETEVDLEMSLRAAQLLMTRAKLLIELVLKPKGAVHPMLLKDHHNQLHLLLRLLTTSLPGAVKDVQHLLTTDLQGVFDSLLSAGANFSSIPDANHSLTILRDRICGSNTTVDGNANFQNVSETTESDADGGLNTIRHRLCSLDFESLLKEVRELALLTEIKNTSTPSTSDLVSTAVSLHNFLTTLHEPESNTFVLVDPANFPNLTKWFDLPQQLFGVSADVYWEKSEYLLAKSLEPLVALSRNESPEGKVARVLIGVLNAGLRTLNFVLSFAEGGNVSLILPEAYEDKPLVVDLLHYVSQLTELSVQYKQIILLDPKALGSLRSLVGGSLSVCKFNRNLLNETKTSIHQNSLDVSLLKNFTEFLCNLEKSQGEDKSEEGPEASEVSKSSEGLKKFMNQMKLLLEQLLPWNLPRLANESVKVDSAMLATQLNMSISKVKDLLTKGEGDANHSVDWSQVLDWNQPVEELLDHFNRTPEVVTSEIVEILAGAIVAEVGVDDAKVAQLAAAIWRVAGWLAIGKGDLGVDLTSASQYGSVGSAINNTLQLRPYISSLLAALPTSRLYYELLLSYQNLSKAHEEICSSKGGIRALLKVPDLPEKSHAWDALQNLLCNLKTDQLLEDLKPLWGDYEEVLRKDRKPDWLKVVQTVKKAFFRVQEAADKWTMLTSPWSASLNESAKNPLIGVNISMTSEMWVRGAFLAGSLAHPLLLNMLKPSDNYYQILVRGAALLRPLANITDISLETLTNATRLRALMQTYKNLLSQTQASEDSNSEMSDQNDEASMERDKFIALRQFYDAFQGALRVLGPLRELREDPEKVLPILRSVVLNADFVVSTGLQPICSIPVEEHMENSEGSEGEIKDMEFDAKERQDSKAKTTGGLLGAVRRQLIRWPSFVHLACKAKDLNLSQLVNTLRQEFNWSQDIKYIQEMKEGQVNVTCSENIHLAGLVSQQVVKLVLEYQDNKTAAFHLYECMDSLLSSPALLQLSSLMEAAALLADVDVANVTKDVTSSIADLPGISSALNALSARLPLFKPVSLILVDKFEEYLPLKGDLLDIFKKCGLIDVNRVYGSTNNTLKDMSSSMEKMKKFFKFDKKALEEADTETRRRRRRRRSLETPLDARNLVFPAAGDSPNWKRIKRTTLTIDDLEKLLYEQIQEIGVEAFGEGLSTSINYEYVLDNIEEMRMEAVVDLSLEPLATGLSDAFLSMQSLIDMGAIFDLSKVVSGETDPLVVFQKVNQMLQHETWEDLSKSLTGIMDAAMPSLASSEVGDDIHLVQHGVDVLEAATDWALLDPTYPVQSLVDNWDQLSSDLTTDLGLDPEVVDLLQGAVVNLLPLVTFEEGTVKDVICREDLLAQVLLLPEDTIISSVNVSKDLCSVDNVSGLASALTRHLDLGPLLQKMLRFSINITLTSYDLTEEDVTNAVRMLTEAWKLWPEMTAAHSEVLGLLEELEAPGVSLRDRIDSLESLSSKEFLERSGRVLCGHTLKTMPDSLSLVQPPKKPPKKVHKRAVSGMCNWFLDQLAEQPGGKVVQHYVRPLIRGKLFYAPNNAFTQRIIAQANATFETVDRLKKIMAGARQAGSQMSSSRHRSDNLQKLHAAVKAPWVAGLLNQLSDSVNLQQLEVIANKSLPDLTSQVAQDMDDLLEHALEMLDCLLLDRFVGASDEEEMLEMARGASRRKEFLAGIVFEDTQQGSSALPKQISYRLRVDYDNSPNTDHLLPLLWVPGPYSKVAQNMRYHRGFVQLQQLLDDAIIKEQLDQRTGSLDNMTSYPIETKQQPYPCHAQDRFLETLNNSPVLSILFSFVAFTALIMFLIRDRMQERESKSQQLQEVMGKLQWVDLLLWSSLALVQLLVLLLPIALILKFGGLQPRSDFGLLFLLLLAYGISIVAFCYLMSCVTTSSVLAIFLGVMSVMIFNTPFISVSLLYSTTPFFAYVLLCLFPSSAFSFGLRVICQYEMHEVGALPENFWKPPTTDNDMTLGLAIVMMLVDALVFILIAVIVNISKKYREALCLRLWAPSISLELLISAKRPRGSGAGTDGALAVPDAPSTPRRTAGYTYNIFQDDRVHLGDLDPGLRQSLKKGLSVVGLRKIYQSREGSMVAVDNLSLELYEGQILALLGHNGAGKTTIISMLTGEKRPTAGHIEIYGNDIARRWNRARRFIGLCPQDAVTFLLLTVEETIEYYVRMKGVSKYQVVGEVDRTLSEMGLYRHRRMLAHQLSGGLLRRLCLAIAFCGNSKMVILDEPTSGVDPAARTAIWEVISSHRGGRTILLTTHHLDEAETLADRVAILHQGKLICVGSPLALKSEYGSGYNVTFSARRPSSGQVEDGFKLMTPLKEPFRLATPPKVILLEPKREELWVLLKEYVPNVRLLQDVNGEVTYSLPLQDPAGNGNRLPELMGKIEENLSSMGFASFEIRPTNLEDVVLALSTVHDLDNSISKNSSSAIENAAKDADEEDLKANYSFRVDAPVEGPALVMRRLGALLLKRFLHHHRDWRFYLQIIVLPLVFITLAMIGSSFRPDQKDPVALELSADLYTSPASSFVRNLDANEFGDLEDQLVKVCAGTKDDLKLKTCPSKVSSTTPEYRRCPGFINASTVKSECWCSGRSCVLDVSTQPSLDKFLVATRQNHIKNRFIGYTLGAHDDSSNSSLKVLVWYDNSGLHALPAALNILSNARLRTLLKDEDLAIRATNHPVRLSGFRLEDITTQQYVADLGIGLLLMVALTAVCCCTVAYSVAERTTGERRVLLVTGVSRSVYWVSAYIWDSGVLLLHVLLVSLVLLAFNRPEFVQRHNLGGFILLAYLYGQSLLPLYYLAESFFKGSATAVVVFFCTSFGLGLLPVTVLTVLDEITQGTEGNNVSKILKFLFLILPPFAFISGSKDMGFSYTKARIMEQFEEDAYVSPFTWDTNLEGGLGIYYLMFFIWALLSHLTLHGWRRCFGPLPQPVSPKSTSSSEGRWGFASAPRAGPGAEEDRDVAAERIKIQCGGASVYDSVLRVVGLGRDFTSPPVTAVSALYLALKKGECFGLLGLNGAGKTTAFRCLTGDLRPTRGVILINGKPLEEALKQERPVMSYCPQSHALDPNLTPSEALGVMARIRGFPSNEIPEVVLRALARLGLTQHATTLTKHLSGGCKRKLSTALALLGDPLLVLLDEPTSGMDPKSRRLVWRAVQSVVQSGRTCLLTSHSMDEINHLTHRLAIMVNGHFVCLGSPHYLKHKLGDKYSLKIRADDIEDMSSVIEYLRSKFPMLLLKEHHHLTLLAEVPRQTPLQSIFETLEECRALGITEYDVEQTTLNQVFQLLASHQGDGQLPAVDTGDPEAALPTHLPALQPVTSPVKRPPMYDAPFSRTPSAVPPLSGQGRKSVPPTPVGLQTVVPGTVEEDFDNRRSVYDNDNDDTCDNGGVEGTSPGTSSGTADDSPDEEWTHL